MPRITVIHNRSTTKHQERTGLTVTMNLELDFAARLDEIMLARKHGDFALHLNSSRVPVRCERISIKDAKLGTFFVQHDILGRHGVTLDDVVTSNLALEYNTDQALFAPDEMNPTVQRGRPKVAAADDDAGEDADPADDEEPAPKAPKKPGAKKTKAGRKPRRTPGAEARA